jgi:hypothetical protein
VGDAHVRSATGEIADGNADGHATDPGDGASALLKNVRVVA